VAVFRALQLGDMLCAVPALRALRAALPGARIELIGLPWAWSFADRYAHYLDGFHPFPGHSGLPEQPPCPQEEAAFIARMRRRRFDVVVQMHGNGTVTNELVRNFGAGCTAGCYAPGESNPEEPLFAPYPEDAHEIHRSLRALERLGITPCGEHLEFPLLECDREAGRLLREQAGLTPGGYVCLHPGSRSARRWPVEQLAAVGDALAETGLRVVITGTEAEHGLARELAGRLRARAVNLAGRTDLGGAAALLCGARLLVCNNTGVSHLAAALRVRSVVLIDTPAEAMRWAPLDAGRHRRVIGFTGSALGAVLRECRDLLDAPARPVADALDPPVGNAPRIPDPLLSRRTTACARSAS
jgi:ADP-heptose:LPS heptosyltransferase